MAKIKVCGLTRFDQVQELISLNTDFLGFIFYEKSPRYVLNHLSLEEISKIRHHGKVGVFVNETAERIIEISEKADLNFIQLHGDETEHFISELNQKLNPKIEIIRVIRIGNQSSNELQKTIIIVLHDINFASHYSDYIVALKNGKVKYCDTTDNVINERVLKDVFDLPITICEINKKRICNYFN